MNSCFPHLVIDAFLYLAVTAKVTTKSTINPTMFKQILSKEKYNHS